MGVGMRWGSRRWLDADEADERRRRGKGGESDGCLGTAEDVLYSQVLWERV